MKKSNPYFQYIKYGYVYLESYYSVYDSICISIVFHISSVAPCNFAACCYIPVVSIFNKCCCIKVYRIVAYVPPCSINFIIFRPGYLLLIFERILCKYKPVNQKIYERQYPILPAPSDIRSPNESGSRLSPSRTRIIDITFRCFPSLL